MNNKSRKTYELTPEQRARHRAIAAPREEPVRALAVEAVRRCACAFLTGLALRTLIGGEGLAA